MTTNPPSSSTPTIRAPGGAPLPTVDELAPGTWLGRYRITRLIGRGGMGCVYEAVHRDLGKRVAIKALLPALAGSAESRARFAREGQAAARIRHPHVVDVTDVVADGALTYLVMEYLEGDDLAARIAERGALPLRETADILLPVVAAVAAAHEHGVIHRDLKPENVFLARVAPGAPPCPKVVDFGISKVVGDPGAAALTATSTSFGTLYYLPPEQLRGAREADARSDQYALGTILYECLTGARAFDGDGIYGILKNVAEGRHAAARTLCPDLPAAVDAAIERALSLDPAARFASVRGLGAVLLDFASPAVRAQWAPVCGQGAAAAPPPMPVPGAAPRADLLAPTGTLILPAAPGAAGRLGRAPSTDGAAGVEMVLARSWTPRLILIGIALGIALVALATLLGGGEAVEAPAATLAAAPASAPARASAPRAALAPVPAPIVAPTSPDAHVLPDPSTTASAFVPAKLKAPTVRHLNRGTRHRAHAAAPPPSTAKNDAPIID